MAIKDINTSTKSAVQSLENHLAEVEYLAHRMHSLARVAGEVLHQNSGRQEVLENKFRPNRQDGLNLVEAIMDTANKQLKLLDPPGGWSGFFDVVKDVNSGELGVANG